MGDCTARNLLDPLTYPGPQSKLRRRVVVRPQTDLFDNPTAPPLTVSGGKGSWAFLAEGRVPSRSLPILQPESLKFSKNRRPTPAPKIKDSKKILSNFIRLNPFSVVGFLERLDLYSID